VNRLCPRICFDFWKPLFLLNRFYDFVGRLRCAAGWSRPAFPNSIVDCRSKIRSTICSDCYSCQSFGSPFYPPYGLFAFIIRREYFLQARCHGEIAGQGGRLTDSARPWMSMASAGWR
jgi:hypothetical protein